MPGVREHLAQAEHNERFFGTIGLDRDGDWAMTVLFYTALQYIDAYLASMGELDPGGHDIRDRLISGTPQLRRLLSDYDALKSRSRTARYYAGRFTRKQVEDARDGPFTRIRNHIRMCLGADAAAPGTTRPNAP